MGTRDARVDAYIAKSAEFARPILTHLRDVVHAACPDVEETMKWSFPHFMYKGMLCSMASFKEHCAFGFWKSSLDRRERGGEVEKAMGQFGRITKLSDLPSKKVLSGYIKEAMKLNEDGVKSPTRSKPKTPREVVVPDDLAKRPAGKHAGPGHLREISVPATSANMSSGSPRPRPRPPARDGSRRRSSGWPRASRGTGST